MLSLHICCGISLYCWFVWPSNVIISTFWQSILYKIVKKNSSIIKVLNCIFYWKEIRKKTTCKILVKLTTGLTSLIHKHANRVQEYPINDITQFWTPSPYRIFVKLTPVINFKNIWWAHLLRQFPLAQKIKHKL